MGKTVFFSYKNVKALLRLCYVKLALETGLVMKHRTRNTLLLGGSCGLLAFVACANPVIASHPLFDGEVGKADGAADEDDIGGHFFRFDDEGANLALEFGLVILGEA